MAKGKKKKKQTKDEREEEEDDKYDPDFDKLSKKDMIKIKSIFERHAYLPKTISSAKFSNNP
jgi:hypothetical protein